MSPKRRIQRAPGVGPGTGARRPQHGVCHRWFKGPGGLARRGFRPYRLPAAAPMPYKGSRRHSTASDHGVRPTEGTAHFTPRQHEIREYLL